MPVPSFFPNANSNNGTPLLLALSPMVVKEEKVEKMEAREDKEDKAEKMEVREDKAARLEEAKEERMGRMAHNFPIHASH